MTEIEKKQNTPYWVQLRNHNPMNNLIDPGFWEGYLIAAIGWLAAFMLPVAPFLIFTICLVIGDLYTGTKAAKKRGEVLHSRGLMRTTEKIIVYFIAILLASGMREVFMPSVKLEYVVAFTIALSELKSNLENIEVITGVNIWARLIEIIRKPTPKA